jgi:SpoIID/LytB domain protein
MTKIAKSILSAVVSACLLGGSMGAARATEVIPVPAGFTITGAGWGHGLGMSQYGAYGMALDGATYEDIIKHYYTGAAPVSTSPNPAFRVGIETGQTTIFARAEDNPVDPGVAGNLTVVIDSVTTLTFAPMVELNFTFTDTTFTLTSSDNQTASGTSATLTWDNATTLLNLNSGTLATTALGVATCTATSCSNRYRYGSFSIKAKNAVNILRLNDQYLYGLGEMPSSWALEALKAQVVAARSFAISRNTVRTSCDCNIGVSDSDQVFVGFAKEVSTDGNRWVQAVNETSGLAIYSGSTLVPGYYSSSTGGKTQPRSQVWGSSTISWLVSVDDRWSQDPRVRNPNASWTATVDQASLVARLRAQGVQVADVWSMSIAGNYPSGGISKINLSDSAGNITTLTIAPSQPVTPDELRGVLGTKSTFISSITPGITTVPGSTSASAKKLKSVTKVNWPSKTVKPADLSFSGKVSPAQVGANVKLQKKIGGKWKTVSTATTNSKGSWSILWTGPTAGNHDLRITASNSKGTIKTTTKRVRMAGTIGVSAPKSAKRNTSVTVSGSVSPGFADATVIVERKIGNGSWKRIGTVTTDESGKWAITHKTTSKKLTVSYRAKTSDSRLGVLVSKTKNTKVK